MSEVFDVVLLLALPASGKSEVRNFMAHMDPEVLAKDFHIGQTLQLDDFPYVFLMDRIDGELAKMGHEPLFRSPTGSLGNGVLIKLLNQDYYSLVSDDRSRPESYAKLMFERFDKACEEVGDSTRTTSLEPEVREKVMAAVEEDCRHQFDERLSFYPDDSVIEGKTIMIEMARGGSDGASMPLQDPFGYQYSLRQFCPEILERATILYIWVTPEESRRKNFDRADPNDPGSILNHGVPLDVMLREYGCDDMLYLKETSEVEDTVTVKAYGNSYHLPLGIFDNRVDKTTPFRSKPEFWKEEQIAEVTEGIKQATDTMYRNYRKLQG